MTDGQRIDVVMREYAQQHPDGFTSVFNKAYERLLRLGASPEDAEDSAQEAFMAALTREGRDTWEDIAGLKRWVLTVATNIYHRGRRRVPGWGGIDIYNESLVDRREPAPGAELENEDSQSRLRSALRGLPETQRNCLLFHYSRGWSYSQISRETGLSVGTIKGAVHRAKNTLKTVLQV